MEFEIDYQKNKRKKRRKRLMLQTLIWVLEIVAVVGLAFFLTRVVFEKTVMPGDSMEKTLSDQDTLVINKLAYLFSEPSRFDVIVFKPSGREHDYYDIKRIIGLPGETVQITDGKIYINGKLLEDRIVCEDMLIAGLAKEPVTLEEQEYFVLGDNRNHSEDSRFANVGNIIREDIIGKAWLRLNHFGFVNLFNLKHEEEDAGKDEVGNDS